MNKEEYEDMDKRLCDMISFVLNRNNIKYGELKLHSKWGELFTSNQNDYILVTILINQRVILGEINGVTNKFIEAVDN